MNFAEISKNYWGVYAILDPEHVPVGMNFETLAGLILQAGVKFVQLRDKISSTRELLVRAKRLAALCEAYDAYFIVNDRVDIALASGAHGVHLGPDDLDVESARRIAPALIIGGSAGSVEQALALEAAGANYLGVGAIYEARAVKPNASAPRGLDVLRDVTAVVKIPVVGIGGVTLDKVGEVIAAGASGVAVIRQISASREPGVESSKLIAAVQAAGGFEQR